MRRDLQMGGGGGARGVGGVARGGARGAGSGGGEAWAPTPDRPDIRPKSTSSRPELNPQASPRPAPHRPQLVIDPCALSDQGVILIDTAETSDGGGCQGQGSKARRRGWPRGGQAGLFRRPPGQPFPSCFWALSVARRNPGASGPPNSAPPQRAMQIAPILPRARPKNTMCVCRENVIAGTDSDENRCHLYSAT